MFFAPPFSLVFSLFGFPKSNFSILQGESLVERNTMTEEKSIDLFEVALVLWKKKFHIILFIILGISLMLLKTVYFQPDTFTADGSMIVKNSISETTTSTDITTAQKMVRTCTRVMQGRSFMQLITNYVNAKLNTRYDWEDIKKMISFTLDETEIVNISVVSRDATLSFAVADAILKYAPEKITTVYKGSDVNVCDEAVFPEGPNDRGAVKNVLIGALVGLVIGVADVMIAYFLDTKLQRADDITKRYNISVLGELE